MKRPFILAIVALLLLTFGACSADTPESNETKAVARILARNATAAISFNDEGAAKETIHALNTTEYFLFGVLLNSGKKVIASYSRPEEVARKEKFVAHVLQSIPLKNTETLKEVEGYILAVVPVELAREIIGYVAVGRKLP